MRPRHLGVDPNWAEAEDGGQSGNAKGPRMEAPKQKGGEAEPVGS